MTDVEQYRELGTLTKNKEAWEEKIPYVVKPYFELLHDISQTDSNRVVRIHCLGAIRAAGGDSRLTN